ncbi:MAG: mechanosensitive ion channel [Candidatus Bathyarchaeota archaeon]|nr:MAG: mechanosensitive ion channel [Candidatus Bathyarchaeota archaeon]
MLDQIVQYLYSFNESMAQYLGPNWFPTMMVAVITLIGMFVADKLIRRAIERYFHRLKIEEHASNILKLIARILIFACGLAILLGLFGVSGEVFISISALSGAAIGFASTQTVGNFLAGLYIMISRPFMIKDYVKIGDVEGEVREITINYTKIYTPVYNITEIPNRKVLDSTIINYSGKKNIIDYSFEIEFTHEEPNSVLINDCIVPAIDEFYAKYQKRVPKKPVVSMSKVDRWGRVFLIRMFFPEGKINMFYEVQPELLQMILEKHDQYRIEKKTLE